jgi:hypothetical protein
MTSAAWPLQQAIYARLTGDASLMGAVSGVYDYVPEGAAYPYVAIGEAVEVPNDSHDRPGLTVTFTLHIWSRYRGTKQAIQILGHVDRLLNRTPLAVAGFRDVSLVVESSQMMRDPDPEIRHVPVRLRAWLTKE